MHRIVGYVDATQILLHAIELNLSHGLRREILILHYDSDGRTLSSMTKASQTDSQEPRRSILARPFTQIASKTN